MKVPVRPTPALQEDHIMTVYDEFHEPAVDNNWLFFGLYMFSEESHKPFCVWSYNDFVEIWWLGGIINWFYTLSMLGCSGTPLSGQVVNCRWGTVRLSPNSSFSSTFSISKSLKSKFSERAKFGHESYHTTVFKTHLKIKHCHRWNITSYHFFSLLFTSLTISHKKLLNINI